jgi:hypothetical protein
MRNRTTIFQLAGLSDVDPRTIERRLRMGPGSVRDSSAERIERGAHQLGVDLDALAAELARS